MFRAAPLQRQQKGPRAGRLAVKGWVTLGTGPPSRMSCSPAEAPVPDLGGATRVCFSEKQITEQQT